jgi:hypothetical protein
VLKTEDQNQVPVAVVKLFSRWDLQLWQDSSKTLCLCRKGLDTDVIAVDARQLVSVIAMLPDEQDQDLFHADRKKGHIISRLAGDPDKENGQGAEVG